MPPTDHVCYVPEAECHGEFCKHTKKSVFFSMISTEIFLLRSQMQINLGNNQQQSNGLDNYIIDSQKMGQY